MMSLRYDLNDMAMESFYDMRLAQPPKDRLHYFDVVLEGSIETRASLLQKLYVDIVQKSNIDYGQIPDSQGSLIKYKGYKTMSEAIGYLNELFKGVSSDEVTLMNKLHDMIIACKKDYEYGYKFDIEVIKVSYCVSVLTLCELINICILAYTQQVRNGAGIAFEFNKIKKKDVLVIRGAKSLVKSYESGQWTKIMNEVKKDPSIIGITTIGAATEGRIYDFAKDAVSGAADGLTDVLKNQSIGGKINATIDKIPNAIKVPAKIIGIVIGIFIAIRALVTFFYYGANKIKDYAKTQQDFINLAVQNEKENGTPDTVISKHTKLADKLGSIASFIEAKILKTNSDAKKAIDASDKENFSKSELSNTSTFGGDISF